MFTFIMSFESSNEKSLPLPDDVRDEVVLAALLAPMAYANLRSPLKETLSITDASEQGGAAGKQAVLLALSAKKWGVGRSR